MRAREGDAEAASALDATLVAVDATEDLVAQAVTRLARAALLEEVGSTSAGAAHDDAELRLRELGIAAEGWRTVFRLVLSPAAAAV